MTRSTGDERWGRATAAVAVVVLAAAVLAVVASGSAAAAADDGTNATFEYEGQRLTLAASAGQEIAVETGLPAGEVVTVRIRSTGQSPFLRSPQATVGTDGRAVATVDLSRVAPGTPFEATVLHNGTALGSADGVVGNCQRDCEPTPTPDDDAGGSETGDEWLTKTIVMTRLGDAATVPVAVPDDGPVTLTIAGDGYHAIATARDADGDGRIVFRFDTGAAGTPTPAVTAMGRDEVTLLEEGLNRPRFRPSTYDVNVTDGEGATSPEVDIGSLVVRECPGCASGGDGGVDPDGRRGTPAWPDDESLLAASVVRVRTGGVGQIPLNVDGAAAVTVGTARQGYRLDATVRDENGDGRVALLFYPRNAGRSAPTVAVGGADSVTVTRETDLDGSLPATTYDVSVHRGGRSGDPDDVGALDVVGTNGSGATTPNGSTVGPGGNAAGTQQFTSGLGAIALGALLAVVGIAVVLGFARS